MDRQRVAVLISGFGSNLQALIEASLRPNAAYEIVLVASDRSEATGLRRAAPHRINAVAIPREQYSSRGSFEAALERELAAAAVDLVCLAGFMRVLSAQFVQARQNRLLNIHPSLLPAFPGLNTHARVLASGSRISGCTVHLVRAEIDAGPILVQGVVPVLAADDAQGLAARVLEIEHTAYPRALHLFASGRLKVLEDEIAAADAEAAAGRLILHPSLIAPTGGKCATALPLPADLVTE